jgi:acetone carboxylase gamma subunit
MPRYDTDTLRQLRDGVLPFEYARELQSNHKDPERFLRMVELAQESVSWDDRILLPYAEHLYVVEKPGGARIVKCECGHEFGDVTRNWKLCSLVYVRDTPEAIGEIYPTMMGSQCDWMQLREYICPSCATLLEVEAVPPGYPIVFDFQPDIDGFLAEWLPADREL